jgi:hypothetical protein
MECDVRDAVNKTYPHSTLSETVMNAAEVFLVKATDICKPRRGQ